MTLRAEKVNLIYNSGNENKTFALKDINLSLKEGQFYGILGPSGSGKSSLLYTLSGLKRPTTGKVYYESQDYSQIDNKSLSRIREKDFGFIFQRHFLLEYMSVLDNVLVPVNTRSKVYMDKAVELLDAMGLKSEINKKPYQLSGGQCQRAAIARALINNPKIVFADEITASLDHTLAFEVMKILKIFCKSSMLLVVTHDESILKEADEIIKIWDGRTKKNPGEKELNYVTT